MIAASQHVKKLLVICEMCDELLVEFHRMSALFHTRQKMKCIGFTQLYIFLKADISVISNGSFAHLIINVARIMVMCRCYVVIGGMGDSGMRGCETLGVFRTRPGSISGGI